MLWKGDKKIRKGGKRLYLFILHIKCKYRAYKSEMYGFKLQKRKRTISSWLWHDDKASVLKCKIASLE